MANLAEEEVVVAVAVVWNAATLRIASMRAVTLIMLVTMDYAREARTTVVYPKEIQETEV
jgi:hypothetical protein